MNRKYNIILFLIIVFAIVIIIPIIAPVPPLQNIQPIEAIKYADSQFEDISGVSVHYREIQNGEPLIIFLHGFGSSTYSWIKVMSPLAQFGTVMAFDRPGFGLTERKVVDQEGAFNPYSPAFQLEIIDHFIQKYGTEKVILVGNSAGGTIAIQYALSYPQNVEGLILVDPLVSSGGGVPALVRPFLNLAIVNRWGPYFVRSIQDRGLELLKLAWFDQNKITDQDLENYTLPLKVENWDIGLWEFTKASTGIGVEDQLSKLQAPVLVLSGAEDQIIPVEISQKTAQEISEAAFISLPNCGHVPQEECPQAFLDTVTPFILALGQ